MWNRGQSAKPETGPLASRSRLFGLTKMLAGAAAAATLLAAGVSTATAQVSQRDRGESDYHVVEDGDTMWDLSGQYFGDTYQWPKLWSHNAHITNPHWIYPGDIVYLREVSNGGQPGANAGQGSGGQQDGGKSKAAVSEGMFLPLGGYIVEEQPQYVGRIVASRKEANMLAEHDTAWVGWGEDSYSEEEKEEIDEEDREQMRQPSEVNPGDKFSVVRESGAVKNDDGEVIARKYIVLGTAEVTDTAEDYYDEIKVTQSWQEIYRGDILIPYERQLKAVKQSQAENDSVARIIDTLQPGTNFGEHQYVFINKGAQDGVRTGNRFFVYQRYEGLHKGLDRALDEKVPWTRVGQVMVLDVREAYSTAVITRSKRELIVGDRLEMYGGH
jgi:hypothetical protein